MRRSLQRGEEEGEPAMEAAEQKTKCKEGKNSDGAKWIMDLKAERKMPEG